MMKGYEGYSWGSLELQQSKETFRLDSGDLAEVPEVVYLENGTHRIGRNQNVAKRNVKGVGYSCVPLKYISGTHCTLRRERNGSVTVQDHSSNGTYVNRMKLGKGKKRILRHGEELHLFLASKRCLPQVGKNVSYILSILDKSINRKAKLTNSIDSKANVLPNSDHLTLSSTASSSPIRVKEEEVGATLSHKDRYDADQPHLCPNGVPEQALSFPQEEEMMIHSMEDSSFSKFKKARKFEETSKTAISVTQQEVEKWETQAVHMQCKIADLEAKLCLAAAALQESKRSLQVANFTNMDLERAMEMKEKFLNETKHDLQLCQEEVVTLTAIKRALEMKIVELNPESASKRVVMERDEARNQLYAERQRNEQMEINISKAREASQKLQVFFYRELEGILRALSCDASIS